LNRLTTPLSYGNGPTVPPKRMRGHGLEGIPPVGRVVPGIELHTAEGLPPVRRTDIADSVHRVEQAGYFDRVACWDILSADQKAIETFAGIAGRDQD